MRASLRAAALLLCALFAGESGAQPGDRALWRLYEKKGAPRPLATAHRDAAGKPRFINALVRERSPYLLDYAHSPIHWLPWEESALAQARAGQKLIFVSIGYSSCHWCHVMARESFDDLGIAAALNRGFVSVKIDSEERPELDRRFLDRLEALGVSPGWPMNFVLTPENEVIWGATYVRRDELLATLRRLESRWKSDRPRLRRLAAAREAQVRARQVVTPAAGSLAEQFTRQRAQIAAEFDPVHKGFGTGPKFHEPAELGFLHDAFLRGAGDSYATMFVETLGAIAGGGVYDAIEGGVFRYSVAPSWRQPHFEKMLYDQAQVSRLMCEGFAITGDPALRRAATGIIDFSLAWFSTPSGIFASSFDAESAGVEGGYYLWTDEELGRLPPQTRRLVAEHFRHAPQSSGDFLLVPLAPAAAGVPEGVLEALRGIRKTRRMPRRDDKAITAWNANMIAALAECGSLLDLSWYQAEAKARMRRLLDTNAAGDRMHRYSIAGEAAGRATIDDLGWVLAALVSLHDADNAAEWIAHARRFAHALTAMDEARLQEELRDFAQDRSGLSSTAMLVRSLARLVRRTQDPVFEQALDRVAPPVRDLAGAPGFAALTAALHERESPMPRPIAHAAQGKVRLSVAPVAAAGPEALFVLVADISPGWHINSHEPTQDYIRPTQVVAAGLDEYKVTYPPGKPFRFGPAGDLLSVLDGSVRFDVRLPGDALAGQYPRLRLKATIQACNDEVCLRPDLVELSASAAAIPRRSASAP